ncbi:hypothetical protein Q7A53_05040 [Halobacillus rhizosphaerae]|uniref:hypothetical protein n=1 Tax=Halobacillus rhizosphaerae TaxID=3064889 RepID=UPI00398B6FC3
MTDIWTSEEIKILKENYQVKGIEKTTALLKRFQASEVRDKAERLGLKRKRKKRIIWSDKDKKKLSELYPHSINADLVEEFAHMEINENDLRRKAHQLGLKKTVEAQELAKQQRMKTRKDGWTDEEIEILKKYYPTHGVKGCMIYLDRSYNAISSQAEKQGLWGTVEKSWMATDITPNENDLFSVTLTYERTDIINDNSSAS